MQDRNQSYAIRIATAQDFCVIFREDVEALYVLSLLVAGDHEKAEQCFLAGFTDCLQTVHVLKERARFWAKRTIIKFAIQIVHPHPTVADSQEQDGVSRTTCEPPAPGEPQLEQILALPDMERIVLVLTVLEGYSERDCARLIGCSSEQVGRSRRRALDQIASAAQGRRPDGVEEEPGPERISRPPKKAA